MPYDASLPFRRDSGTGHATHDTLAQAVHQDLKILLLTSPGERVMDPLFGCGLKNYLFETLNPSTLGAIEARIKQQVKKYLPFIQIKSVNFASAHSSAGGTVVTDMDPNNVSIQISYSFGHNRSEIISVGP